MPGLSGHRDVRRATKLEGDLRPEVLILPCRSSFWVMFSQIEDEREPKSLLLFNVIYDKIRARLGYF